MHKRVLAILLAAALLVPMAAPTALAAYAEEGDAGTTEEIVEEPEEEPAEEPQEEPEEVPEEEPAEEPQEEPEAAPEEEPEKEPQEEPEEAPEEEPAGEPEERIETDPVEEPQEEPKQVLEETPVTAPAAEPVEELEDEPEEESQEEPTESIYEADFPNWITDQGIITAEDLENGVDLYANDTNDVAIETKVTADNWDEYFSSTDTHTDKRRDQLSRPGQKEIYDSWLSQLQDIAAGKETNVTLVTAFSEMSEETRAQMQTFIDEQDNDGLQQYIQEIEKALYNDRPFEFYFVHNNVYTCSEIIKNEDGTVDDELTRYQAIMCRFLVASDYRAEGEEDRSDWTISDSETVQERIKTAQAARANADAIVAEAEGMSLEQALYFFKDRICGLVSYNTPASDSGYEKCGAGPWNMIYCFDMDPDTDIVCEGFARAFKYLYDQWKESNPEQAGTADTYMVGGIMFDPTDEKDRGGGHEWNVIRTDNGVYHVDLTNCDETADRALSNRLFLRAPDVFYYEATHKCMSGIEFSALEDGYRYYEGSLDNPKWQTNNEYTGSEINITTKDWGE